MSACPQCGYDDPVYRPDEGRAAGSPPPEPPVGSWVKDRHGAAMLRHIDSDGNDGWAPAPNFMALANWRAMWERRGPLVPCGPYGRDLP